MGGKVVAGGKITDARINNATFKEKKPEFQFLAIPSYGVYQLFCEYAI